MNKSPLSSPSLAAAASCQPAPAVRAHEAAQQMADAAKASCRSHARQKAKAVFHFDTTKSARTGTSSPASARDCPCREMTPEQRLLAHALLSTGLSNRGHGQGQPPS